jgi:ribosomal protein S18 acetylase RimI-like enzyme
MRICKASEADFDAMWAIFQTVVATGDTLPFSSATSDEFFRAQWLGDSGKSFVALLGTTLCGMYKFGPNLPGLGSHVASATYLVGPEWQGRGIGRAMVEHSLVQAEQAGFAAMQFNYVVATNKTAIRLYEKLRFSIVGTLPNAFRHQQLGLVDAHVMHRFLGLPDD